MKTHGALMPTLKEKPQEAEFISHILMVRAGLIRNLASGVYSYLPMGWRVIRKIEAIVREEMDAMGGQELLLPALNPAELWQETGRWDEMGANMMRLKDRNNRDFCLGMTHEEVITDLARREIKSYKDLPVILYQIQTKFRDEPRPRGGVIRAREFIMKDMYSFHKNLECLNQTYEKAYKAYCNAFDRCGLNYKVVLADPGPMGGGECHEFITPSPSGEDTIFSCACGYAANAERASFYLPELPALETPGEIKSAATPDIKTIKDLVEFFNKKPHNFLKTLIYEAQNEIYAVLLRGDREVNEAKLKRALGVKELSLANDEVVYRVSNAPVGFAGPIGLREVKIIADLEIKTMSNMITGANQQDVHLINVNYPRDFEVDSFADISTALPGDCCPKCCKELVVEKGIEIGHIFKLGTKYSDAMHAVYLDEQGKEQPFIMGCYGIGVSRIASAVLESWHDANGIIWPLNIAPYQVLILPVISTEPAQMQMAEQLYQELRAAGLDVLMDNRDLRPGFKFKDADLWGIPIRITIGEKAVKENLLEIKIRKTGENILVGLQELKPTVQRLINS